MRFSSVAASTLAVAPAMVAAAGTMGFAIGTKQPGGECKTQQDYKDEKSKVEILIEKAGHLCIFLPKFHCELNPIEMVRRRFPDCPY